VFSLGETLDPDRKTRMAPTFIACGDASPRPEMNWRRELIGKSPRSPKVISRYRIGLTEA